MDIAVDIPVNSTKIFYIKLAALWKNLSLSKKDATLRVAANDPHLVSLGGGRLSTAVTIHNIPVGDCAIGSSTQCAVSINGAGVQPIHCTIYRSEENQVTLVPEQNARILIDNKLIKGEVNLRQGAMITIGDSYYLRYNNPAEALQIRTAIDCPHYLDYFYESNINPGSISCLSNNATYSYYDNLKESDSYVDLMGWQCPKVFSSDLVTVNMHAKDVLGQKYASFAKNLAEHHCKAKKVDVLNTNCHIKNDLALSNSISKIKDLIQKEITTATTLTPNDFTNLLPESKMNEGDPLEDMLKMCADYTDHQDRSYSGSSSVTSSPVVQNRIKTNGSLPRDKKSIFYQELQSSFKESNNTLSQSSKSSGNENLYQQIDFVTSYKSSGYENVKLVPQSPRTKIRTNCMSPKRNSIPNSSNSDELLKNFEYKLQKETEDIEESLKSVGAYSIKTLSNNSSPITTKQTNKNNNSLTIDIKSFASPYNSPTTLKKPTPAPRKIIETKGIDTRSLSNILLNESSNDSLHKEREDLLQRIKNLKTKLNSLQELDNEALIEMDLENAFILAELEALTANKQKLEHEYQLLRQNIHRLEAQRNATRVMEENQQSKLKHSIEMKQDQMKKLKEIMKQKPDKCLKEEIENVRESLENDKKTFEDLEFQYLEGETEWQAYRDDVSLEEQVINKKIHECQLSIENLKKQQLNYSFSVNANERRLSNHLISLIKELRQCEDQFKLLERKFSLKTISNCLPKQQQKSQNQSTRIMQSSFGSTEIICPKISDENLMSKSLNENLLYNKKIEFAKRESRVNNTMAYIDSLNLKTDTSKIFDTLQKIGKQRQLLNTKRELRDLDHERRIIKELLNTIKTDGKQPRLITTRKKCAAVENENKSRIYISTSETLFCNPSVLDPLSATPIKILPQIVNKSFKELSASSPETSRSLYLEDKCTSSVLSNEFSSQGDCSTTSCDRNKMQQKQKRPPTHYLFAEDLDLKRHIEYAGHPLSLCPHAFLDTYSCRGYLHKLGSMFHTWSKRWFVFDRRRRALIYYADKSERKPRGGAYFSCIDEVYMDHLNISKSNRPHSTFIVKTKKRTFYLQASSDTAARIWIDAIITGAQGSINY